MLWSMNISRESLAKSFRDYNLATYFYLCIQIFIQGMQIRLLFIASFLFCLLGASAQQTPSEIKFKAWDMHALRYYPFTQPADSFMAQVIGQKQAPTGKTYNGYDEKIAVDLAMHKQFLTDGLSRPPSDQLLLYKYLIAPYTTWLSYARPVRSNSPYLNLALFLSEPDSIQSLLEWIGSENIQHSLEDWLGDIDLWKDRNEVLYSSFKSPLAKDAGKTYRYFFSSRTEIEGVPVYEIVFFSQKPKEKAFEGYLYISVNSLTPVKAVFTVNPGAKKAFVKSVLFTQTLSKKETKLYAGDDISTALLLEQVRIRKDNPAITPDSISPAQKEIGGLVEKSEHTPAYLTLQKGVSLLITDHIGIFHNHFEFGPVTQLLSYNYMEGLRLRIGGFTSQKINRRVSAGGYLAYGTKDGQWKYRGDFIYSPHPANRLQLTYVNDLNIPGKDCLEDKRDNIFYSLSQNQTKNMSLQKIGQVSYEIEKPHRFSLKLNAKYLYDQPLGVVSYETADNGALTAIKDITTTEIGISFRFSPNERIFPFKDKRIVLNSPDVDFRLSHRIGFKGILGSDFNYQITDANLFKSFDLPSNTGSFGILLSGGKVWNPVPFPLLFIPSGNQSYIFEDNDYNLMRFYEFTTDRFVAGNADLHFNWSPVKWFRPKSKLKTHGGIKAVYGPLSDANNPELHPELFIFNNGVEALGKKPYAEAHIGVSGILKFFRLDYVYRLTYGHKGSLFVSTAIRF